MGHFLTRLLEPKTNGSETAYLLASLLNVKISKSTLKKEIEEHPDYPSLLSISDGLSKFGIENIGIKLGIEKISELPVPFITQIASTNKPNNLFTVVKSNDDDITYFDPEKLSWNVLDKKNFSKRCSGIALIADGDEAVGEKDYDIKIKEERRKLLAQCFSIAAIPILLILWGINSFVQYGTRTLLPFSYSLLALFGCLTGVLLIWYELDQYNPVLKKICSAGKNTNCSVVLQSNASKIGGISWSTLGFIYFAGLVLFSFLSVPLDSTALFTFALLSLIAIPYPIFSIYYQWRVAKQWCILCLCVQVVLVLQGFIVLSAGWLGLANMSTVNLESILKIIVAFVIPVIAMMIFLPGLKKAKQGIQSNNELQRLKRNPQIFAALLEKQRTLVTIPDGLGISIGSSHAPYKMIKVCNPYCGPCAEAHKPIENLLSQNFNMQLNILYTASNNEDDERTPPVRHLLAIAENGDEEIIKKALDDWYLPQEKNYNIFAAKYPLNGELKLHNSKIDAMENWCKANNITSTPTIFLSIPNASGETRYYEMPGLYTVEDLTYFFSM